MNENSGDHSTDQSSNSTIFVDNVESRQPWQPPVIEYFNLKYAMAGSSGSHRDGPGTS
jgi:hypothetical protein